MWLNWNVPFAPSDAVFTLDAPVVDPEIGWRCPAAVADGDPVMPQVASDERLADLPPVRVS